MARACVERNRAVSAGGDDVPRPVQFGGGSPHGGCSLPGERPAASSAERFRSQRAEA